MLITPNTRTDIETTSNFVNSPGISNKISNRCKHINVPTTIETIGILYIQSPLTVNVYKRKRNNAITKSIICAFSQDVSFFG